MNDTKQNAPRPTRSKDETLRFSLNEIESLCTKAARGAGMSWGLAEEAGYGCGWLAARGLDGAGVLARHLRIVQGKDWQELSPVLQFDERWINLRKNALCPVSLGATVSDYACVDQTLFDDYGLQIEQVRFPILLLPSIAMAAEDLKKTLCLQIESHRVYVGEGADVQLQGIPDDVLLAKVAAVAIFADSRISDRDTAWLPDNSDTTPEHRTGLTPVSLDTSTVLHHLALRTTVPTSAASRANAGAKSSDND